HQATLRIERRRPDPKGIAISPSPSLPPENGGNGAGRFFPRGRNIVLFKWKALMCSAISKCSPTLTYGISRISDVPSSTPDIRDFDKWDQQDMDEKRIKATTVWVKWVFEDGTSEYFPAEILHLG
ncbi:hypothetical protein MTO96_037823, partial [Rhipicephalus appendiculatus]